MKVLGNFSYGSNLLLLSLTLCLVYLEVWIFAVMERLKQRGQDTKMGSIIIKRNLLFLKFCVNDYLRFLKFGFAIYKIGFAKQS